MKTTGILFILFCHLSAVSGQITSVRVEATNTQALISYQAPSAAACSVRAADMNLPVSISNASGDGTTVTVDTRGLAHAFQAGQTIYLEGTGIPQWEGWQTVGTVPSQTRFTFAHATAGSSSAGQVGLLVHDVNPALFPGSDLDSRTGNLQNGLNRTFVLGTRRAENSGGVNYSRALQLNSRHQFTITCGTDLHSGVFHTANIPLGSMAVDRPSPAFPGGSAWPSLDKSGRWEKSEGIFLDRVVDPLTGALYTQMYPPEIVTDTNFGLSAANTPPPAGANWTNPGNVRAQDGATAAYASTERDILCVRPSLVQLSNTATKAAWWTQNISLENLTVTVRARADGAAQDDRDIEIALSKDGCLTPGTEWKTLSPASTLSNLSFPSGTPKGGFAEWHSPTQRRFNHIDVVTRRGFLNTSGTVATLIPDTSFQWISMFDTQWGAGSKIRIGGSTNDTCSAGTEYDVASVQSPRDLTLATDAGANTNTWWCGANFAVMVRKKTVSPDPVEVDYVNFSMRTTNIPGTHFSGSAKIFSEKPVVDGDGNVGYLSYSSGQAGSTSTIHWVSKDNGESRFIMGHLVNLPGQAGTNGWASGICAATENSFVSTEPESLICAMNGNAGGQVMVKYTIRWDGPGKWKSQPPSANPFPVCSSTSPPSPNPCLSMVNMHAGYSLAQLMQARNPEFDPSKFAGCGIRGIQTHLAVLNCSRGPQDTLAWIGAYDLDKPIVNYNPADQSTNPVIGAMSTTHPSLRGWAVLHTGWVMPGSDRYIVFDPKFGRKNSAANDNGAGPWRMAIVGDTAINATTDVFPCPANQWNHANCSTIHVTSQPFDPDPGAGETGAPGEYGTMAVGNGVRFFRCDSAASAYTRETITENVANTGCQSYANDEYGRILAISGTAPDITLTVARGLSSGGMKSHVSGWSLFQWPLTDYNSILVDINIIWDVLACPTGCEEHVKFARTNTSHGSMTAHAAVGHGVSGGFLQLAWRNPTVQVLAAPPQVNLGLPFFVWPTQFGKSGLRFANTIQRYNANNHTDFPPEQARAYQWYVDSRPFLGAPNPDVHPLFEKVSGAMYLYRYKKQQQGDFVYPFFKHLPYLIYVQNKILTEKSGPAVTLADSSEDHWKFCTAYRPGECFAGSSFGDIYVNVPYLNLTNLPDYRCYGGYSWEEADICATPLDPVMGPGIQFYFGNSDNMGLGRHVRKLGWGLQEQPKLYGQVPKVYPNGQWLGPLWTNFLNSHRTGGLMMKLPPIPPEDSYDRTTFVPVPVSAGTAPAGTSVAQIEFGYHDFGTPAQLYCTSRAESCLATGTRVIGDALHMGWTTSNQNATWQRAGTTVSTTTPVRLTFSSAHKLTDDVKLRASTSTSGNNVRVWPISVVSPTQVDLIGSVSGDVSASTTTVLIPKAEAPFAFSGESFPVAGAANASPIEISTPTMHRFQTGSTVCLSGVSGNTAANGCWTVTATGPSSFTLDGSSGNGAYAGGGTVVPGGVPCASGCTVTVPALSKHVLYYRWRYLNAGGNMIATSAVQAMVTP